MTHSITPASDGSYVDVFVPISFKRFGGRKTIVAPDGSRVAPNRGKATDSTLIKALSRAYRWQKLFDDGVYSSIAEVADKERINRSYLSRTIRLSLLAPDIVEAILVAGARYSKRRCSTVRFFTHRRGPVSVHQGGRMSREFTLHLLQKDLQTQNERWLKLKLTSPRVISPLQTMWPAKHHWLSTGHAISQGNANYYHMWGLWSLGLNSVTVGPDDGKTLGLAPPERRGWRYSLISWDLEFVEFWQMTDSPPTIETVAVLNHARQTDRGFAPFSPTGERTAKWTDFGRGFIQRGSGFLDIGSVTWNLE